MSCLGARECIDCFVSTESESKVRWDFSRGYLLIESEAECPLISVRGEK